MAQATTGLSCTWRGLQCFEAGHPSRGLTVKVGGYLSLGGQVGC